MHCANNKFQRDLIHETEIFKLIIPSIVPTRLFLLANPLNCTIPRATSWRSKFECAHRFSALCLPYRFLAFLLVPPETSTNFSSISTVARRRRRQWWWRQRAEIIIGVGRADYSRTMRATGPINGFLNDHCPGEYPVYIRGKPPPLLLQP